MGRIPGESAVLVAGLVVAEVYLLRRYFDRGRSPCAGDRRRELGEIVLGVAMIGMAVPPLDPLPPLGWLVVLGAGTGWFGRRSWRALTGRIPCAARRFGWPVGDLHQLVGYLATGYLVLVEPMHMPGGSRAGGLVPALAPSPVVTGLLAGYFVVVAAGTAYRTVTPRPAGAVRPSAAVAVPGLPAGPRAVGGCRLVMALAMVQMLGSA